MVYITGDTHGDFSRFYKFSQKAKPTNTDVMIILGDAGLNYYGNRLDALRKSEAAVLPMTFFCIHGNHEMRPEHIASYKKCSTWMGGRPSSSAALTAWTSSTGFKTAGSGSRTNNHRRPSKAALRMPSPSGTLKST